MKRSKKMFTVMVALCVALSMAMASVTANAATKKPKKIYLKATSTTVDIKGKVRYLFIKQNLPRQASPLNGRAATRRLPPFPNPAT